MVTSLFEPLRACANEIREVVKTGRHEGYSGLRDTQYHLDLAADEVALRVLHGAGFRVMSEESGVTGEGEFTVVIDPIDGSTNCDQGIPFFATSLAVMKGAELVAGLVMNQSTGTVFEASVVAGHSVTDARLLRVARQSSPARSWRSRAYRHVTWAGAVPRVGSGESRNLFSG